MPILPGLMTTHIQHYLTLSRAVINPQKVGSSSSEHRSINDDFSNGIEYTSAYHTSFQDQRERRHVWIVDS